MAVGLQLQDSLLLLLLVLDRQEVWCILWAYLGVVSGVFLWAVGVGVRCELYRWQLEENWQCWW